MSESKITVGVALNWPNCVQKNIFVTVFLFVVTVFSIFFNKEKHNAPVRQSGHGTTGGSTIRLQPEFQNALARVLAFVVDLYLPIDDFRTHNRRVDTRRAFTNANMHENELNLMPAALQF